VSDEAQSQNPRNRFVAYLSVEKQRNPQRRHILSKNTGTEKVSLCLGNGTDCGTLFVPQLSSRSYPSASSSCLDPGSTPVPASEYL